MTMSDRIAVMMGGRILQCATPEVIYEDPDTIEVAEFIGSPKINILPVTLTGNGRLAFYDQELDLRATDRIDGAVSLGLRPEALHLAPDSPVFHGTVAHTENLGAELFVQFDVPGLENRVVMRSDPSHRAMLTLGTRAGIGFDTSAALVFDGNGQRARQIEIARQRATAEVA
jgi:multiple sugar transport system ATP-binding protein